MNNDDFVKLCQETTNPKVALALIAKHQDYLGYDPYFGDLRDALIGMADRISGAQDPERSIGDSGIQLLKPKFVLWSNMKQGFWRPYGEGYTQDLGEAGRYSEAEAMAITKGSIMPDGSPRTVMMLPPEEIEALGVVLRDLATLALDVAVEARGLRFGIESLAGERKEGEAMTGKAGSQSGGTGSLPGGDRQAAENSNDRAEAAEGRLDGLSVDGKSTGALGADTKTK